MSAAVALLAREDGDKFERFLDQAMAQAKQIMLQKRALRGTANIQRQGLQGVITRITEDKLERVKRHVETLTLRDLLSKRNVPQEDIDRIAPVSDAENTISFEDDLLDMANYAFIAVALNRGLWE